MKHSPSHGLFWGVACITFLLLDTPYPSFAQDGNASKLTEYFRSIRSPQGNWFPTDTPPYTENLEGGVFYIEGLTMPFCNMFGCEMGDTNQP
ncbi:hypothetical protein AVEN_199324-1, partial [Araneus ventricosus]